MATIRVLLIEDNRLLREGATAILNAQPDIKAVSVGGTNGDALAKARAFKPHVVLLDLGLRNMSSIKIVQSMRKDFPKTEVIVMDLIPAHADVAEFVKEGVAGFILKDATLDDFLHTIRSVAKGIKVLPPP
ncbi:MAG TPA: response regulator transcription factor [Acidobacteriota bacterium]|nr:response regulator transcription factor [Acidobacteriota bacterium]HUV12733.1 response regulator transcription factor [Acidobacteriota bacterium]